MGENLGCFSSSKAMESYPENKNNTDRAKYILTRLKEESYLISQDRLGFTPLVSISNGCIEKPSNSFVKICRYISNTNFSINLLA